MRLRRTRRKDDYDIESFGANLSRLDPSTDEPEVRLTDRDRDPKPENSPLDLRDESSLPAAPAE